MIRVRITKAPALRVLDFDTECRPLHYSEFRDESQITAIAWSWVGEKKVHCEVLEQDLSNERAMFEAFLADLLSADVVTGHYIRRHDLPLISDHCIRFGLPPLRPLMTSDTQADLPRVKGLGKSQDNLSLTFGTGANKHHMAGAQWRAANMLDPTGRASARKRVVDDVIQHKELRAELIRRGLLRSPKVWHP